MKQLYTSKKQPVPQDIEWLDDPDWENNPGEPTVYFQYGYSPSTKRFFEANVYLWDETEGYSEKNINWDGSEINDITDHESSRERAKKELRQQGVLIKESKIMKNGKFDLKKVIVEARETGRFVSESNLKDEVMTFIIQRAGAYEDGEVDFDRLPEDYNGEDLIVFEYEDREGYKIQIMTRSRLEQEEGYDFEEVIKNGELGDLTVTAYVKDGKFEEAHGWWSEEKTDVRETGRFIPEQSGTEVVKIHYGSRGEIDDVSVKTVPMHFEDYCEGVAEKHYNNVVRDVEQDAESPEEAEELMDMIHEFGAGSTSWGAQDRSCEVILNEEEYLLFIDTSKLSNELRERILNIASDYTQHQEMFDIGYEIFRGRLK